MKIILKKKLLTALPKAVVWKSASLNFHLNEHPLIVVSFKGITGSWQLNVTVNRCLSQIEDIAVGKDC